MNIALITASFLPMVGGLEWKVHYLATEYIKNGHNVTVFAPKPTGDLRSVSLDFEPAYDLVRCGISFPGCARIGFEAWMFCRMIMKFHEKKPFDVLHCHPITLATQYGLKVKKITGVPVVATTSGSDIQVVPEINYGYRLQKRYDKMVRSNLRQVDVVGSISSSIRLDLESLDPAAKIVDIPNGVAWDDFQVGKSTQLRDLLGIKDQTQLVLSVGRNHIKKGYEYGIRSFAAVAPKIKDACYVIVGKNTSRLSDLVNELKMTDRIRLVEQVPMERMPYIYQSADVFFNPSLVEGFAQVNAQALACGLPCVLTDAPGNIDGGDDGGALIARSENVVSMAEKLTLLIGDADLRQKLAKQAHLASRKYAWSNIAQQYLSIFEDLLLDRTSS